MTWSFYYLCKNPDLQRQLREELEPIMKRARSPEAAANTDLAHAKLLNAVINETMRMTTPVGTGGPRITPAEGITVGDTWIPGEVNVYTPHHVMHRSR